MEENYKLIDDFFNGLLNEMGENEVLRRAETDPEFGKEFELRQKMEDFLKAQPARKSLENQLAVLGEEFFISENKEAKRPEPKVIPMGNSRWRWLAAAAAVAVLLVAVWFGTRPKTSIYREFAKHAPLQINVRSTDAAKITADAETDFNEKNYAAALQNLEILSKNQPDDLTLQLYRAICLLELDRTAEARPIFQTIADGQSALKIDGRWYLALSFLKENDASRCRESLEKFQPGDEHFEAAKRLLEKIR